MIIKNVLHCIILSLMCILTQELSFAQTQYYSTYKFFKTQNYHNQLRLNTKTGEVLQLQDDGGEWTVNYAITPTNNIPRYWLYETQNMWNFILLDTFTGKLWQCQFSVKGTEYIFTVPINNIALVDGNTNRFTIEPMTSMYQYYLIDNETGSMWKFQWSTKSEEGYRWIERFK